LEALSRGLPGNIGPGDLGNQRNVPVGSLLKPYPHYRIADAIVGGWSISGIYRYLSGQLLNFGGMNVSGDPTVSNPDRQRWFQHGLL
jgi:hypothetical protein